MKRDYRQLREEGARVHIDDYNDRVLLTTEDFDGDPTSADEGDEGVIKVYSLDVQHLVVDIFDALSDAGVDIDDFLTLGDDFTPTLSKLRLARDGEE